MEFYTHVNVAGSKVLYRGIKDGNRVQAQLPYSPTLYSLTSEDTGIKTLHGENLRPHVFQTIPEARDFVKERKDVSNGSIYGSNQWQYAWIAENYKNEVPYSYDLLRIASIDIETSVENGFPDPKVCQEEVLLISIKNFQTKKIVTLGCKEADVPGFVLCSDEDDLLRNFIRIMRGMDPDIITGWNVKLFDIAYLFKRIEIRLGNEALQKISPWGKVRETEIRINDRVQHSYAIEGIAVLDLLDLYKKFTFVKRETYKLDHIAEVELGKNKLEMPCDTFKEFYTDHWQKFCEYNQVDVHLVDDLEVKLGLIYLAATVAYMAKVNFEDVFSPVKTWSAFILAVLSAENTFAEIKGFSGGGDDEQIEGAYVKEPFPGFYDWIASFDATSLYPMIILMLNMSPETIVGMGFTCSPEKLLILGLDSDEKNFLKSKNLAMAANGAVFSREKMGIMPRLTETVFGGRKTAKKKMLEAKQKYIDTNDIQYKKEADKQNVIQMALKVLLNSLYGAMANKYFLFYDTRIAEGITLTGQYIIQHVRSVANAKLNKICETKDFDYGFYADTDSLYLTLKPLVEKFFKGKDPAEIVKLLDKTCQGPLTEIIKRGTDDIHATLNAYSERIEFKREAISDRGFWVAKKKYALRVWDNEGVRYDEPELKVMGIEIVRSSTPAVVRDWLKESLPFILDNDLVGLRNFITMRECDFKKLPVEKIAFPRSANNLKEYSDNTSVAEISGAGGSKIYRKGCPMHVRGTLVYNHYLKSLNLDKKYVTINEGDRIKFVYLSLPNKFRENIISFVDRLPLEFGLDNVIDYKVQWEKAFIAPIDGILNAVGWSLEEKSSLEDFFG